MIKVRLCFGGLRDVLTAWDSHKIPESLPTRTMRGPQKPKDKSRWGWRHPLKEEHTSVVSWLWIHWPYLWLCPSQALNLQTWLFIILCDPNNFWISDLPETCPQHLRVLAMSPATEMFLWMWPQLIQFTQHWLLFCSLIKAQNWGKLVKVWP